LKFTENQKLFKEGLMETTEDGLVHLKGSRCTKCGKVTFPQKDFCPDCLSDEMESILLSNEASLYTYTVVHIGVKGFKTPYVLGWVTFPEGIRITSQIDCKPEEAHLLKAGQRMITVAGCLRVLEDQTEVMGYKFVPVEEGK